MSIRLSEIAIKNRSTWFPDEPISTLKDTDPEMAEIFNNFMFDEIRSSSELLDEKTRILILLACAIASQGHSFYKQILTAAFNLKVSPIEIKEVLYQTVPYVGMGKVLDYINITNDFLLEKGVKLPIEGQSTTSPEDRMEKGLATQKGIFGSIIDQNYQTSPENQLFIQKALSDNCFGDYYTRNGLDIKMREILTFSILVTLGVEPQIKGHIFGNVQVGTGKDVLLAVLAQLLPFIGYPRTLNAIRCLNEVIPEK